MNGGVVSALFDCHGNWTAAIALMDKAALPKPPLTLTYEMLVRPASVPLRLCCVSRFPLGSSPLCAQRGWQPGKQLRASFASEANWEGSAAICVPGLTPPPPSPS
jgi:hypothetical protein